MSAILNSSLAGQWYAGDEAGLRREVGECFAALRGKRAGALRAVVVPHAGLRYSGEVAAAGVSAVAACGEVNRVLLIGFTHRVGLPGAASVPLGAEGWRTPLGEVRLDREALEALGRERMFTDEPRTREGENSLELVVPLLQAALEGREWTLVPVTLGQLDGAGRAEAARALSRLWDGRTAVVASSDFTHYGEDFGFVPFREGVAEGLRRLDAGAVAAMGEGAEAFERYCGETGATICGQDPIGVLLRMLPGGWGARELAYGNSGMKTGDWRHCVSYAAVGFGASADLEGLESAAAAAQGGGELTGGEKRDLLRLARTVIGEALKGDAAGEELEDLDLKLTEGLRRKAGVFVTLTEGGELRGCIGELEARRPLVNAVASRALSAAFDDPRFPPLGREELDAVRIEISVLGEEREVGSWREIEAGRHGVVLEARGRRAVFLPQVATEQGWDVETLLGQLSRKAGLDGGAWREEGAKLRVFEATVFHE